MSGENPPWMSRRQLLGVFSAAGIGVIGPISYDAEATVTPVNISGNADQIKTVQLLKATQHGSNRPAQQHYVWCHW